MAIDENEASLFQTMYRPVQCAFLALFPLKRPVVLESRQSPFIHCGLQWANVDSIYSYLGLTLNLRLSSRSDHTF
jgi:hypothetical protein